MHADRAPETSEPRAAGSKPAEVLIAGAGIAGLEALLGLRELAGERVAVTVLSPQRELTYKPMLVTEPFGSELAERRELPPMLAELGARFVEQPLAGIRPAERVAELADGSELAYDIAVLCVGGKPRNPFSAAVTLRTDGRPPFSIDELLADAAEHPSRRIAFLVPPGSSWALPIYEIALLAERRATALGVEVEPLIVTPEPAPLAAFGPAASDAIAELLAGRGIAFRGGLRAHEEAEGEIVLTPGDERLEAGVKVTVPVLEGPAIPGVPADEHGFIPIDDHARVIGERNLYAAGDGTAFPIKQGGLAAQQADAAVEHIAAGLGAAIDPGPFHPVLRGKLLIGEESLSLRADVGGGGGEGVASPDYLWWPPHKVAGRYLTGYLGGEDVQLEDQPTEHPIEVEVALPHGWHRTPAALDRFR